MYIVLEGADGVGKSTQTRLLKDWLCSHGRNARVVANPGETDAALAIRKLVLDKHLRMQPTTQMLLFMAALSETACHVKGWLDTNHDIVADRSYLSSIVYQGLQGVHKSLIEEIAANTNYHAKPDAVVLLDLDCKLAARRKAEGIAKAGDPLPADDRYESEGLQFSERLRVSYQREAQLRGYPVVDAHGTQEEVFERIKQTLATKIPQIAKLVAAEAQPVA